jgi:hypothetical protein
MRFVRAIAGYRMTDRERDTDIRGGQAVTHFSTAIKTKERNGCSSWKGSL